MTENNDSEEVLVFAHIPKTAGTSLLGVVRENYAEDEIEMFYGPRGEARRDAIASGEASFSENLRCVCSHQAQKILPRIPGPYRVFTMLRDPVELVISIYYYMVANAKTGEDGKLTVDGIRQRGWSLEDIYRKVGDQDPARFGLNVFFNIQSNVLCNVLRTDGRYAGPGVGVPGLDNCLPQAVSGGAQEERLAELIFENWVRNGWGVGLTESFGESVGRFADTYGWKNRPIHHDRVGQRPRGNEVSDELRELIARYNNIDMQLWQRASKAFKPSS